MNRFKSKIQNYLKETLGIDVEPAPWTSSRRLPLFLRTDYSHYTIRLEDTEFLIVFDQDTERSAATVQKHFTKIREKWDGEVIYSRIQISSLDRKRLIERKIPFIIPGNQMYLPMLGIDLREYFRQLHDDVDKFSPATSATLLLLFNENDSREYEASELADKLSYSTMTMSRSLNELLNSDLNVVTVEGRTRKLKIMGSRKELWNKSQKYLESPVKQTNFVQAEINAPKIQSGLNALSKYSMLVATPPPMFAMTQDQWKTLESRDDVTIAKRTDARSTGIEVWSYDPALFAQDNCVDRFSLYLAFRDDRDERTEQSLEEMMEAVKW